MTGAQSLLIRLLRDHINRRPTEGAGGDELHGLAVLAAIHGLSGFVTAQLGDRYSGNEENALVSSLGSCAAEYVRRRENYEELKNAFRDAGLWFIPVKGILIAEEYPVPELRVMGDIDIIISKDERRGDTVSYENATCSVDVKAAGSSDTGITEPPEGSAGEIIPDRNEHLVYLIAHLANHIKETGCGIRQFLDLAVFLKTGGTDGERVRDLIENRGFSTFAAYAFGLTEKWFGTPAPYSAGETDPEVSGRLGDEVIRS